MLKPVVFAGPSIFGLSEDETRGIDLRPPAARGDIYSTVMEGATVIGLIDGFFDSTPSVWHKECLYALHAGCTVVGAASMGALRAAECADFGVIGLGTVYRDYVTGIRVSDADVAIVHAPEEMNYEPLSLALVDVEATLLAAIESGTLSRDLGQRLAQAAKRQHFKERTWATIIADAGLDEPASKILQQDLKKAFKNTKLEDSRELISYVKEISPSKKEHVKPSWNLNKTAFFTELSEKLKF